MRFQLALMLVIALSPAFAASAQQNVTGSAFYPELAEETQSTLAGADTALTRFDNLMAKLDAATPPSQATPVSNEETNPSGDFVRTFDTDDAGGKEAAEEPTEEAAAAAPVPAPSAIAPVKRRELSLLREQAAVHRDRAAAALNKAADAEKNGDAIMARYYRKEAQSAAQSARSWAEKTYRGATAATGPPPSPAAFGSTLSASGCSGGGLQKACDCFRSTNSECQAFWQLKSLARASGSLSGFDTGLPSPVNVTLPRPAPGQETVTPPDAHLDGRPPVSLLDLARTLRKVVPEKELRQIFEDDPVTGALVLSSTGRRVFARPGVKSELEKIGGVSLDVAIGGQGTLLTSMRPAGPRESHLDDVVLVSLRNLTAAAKTFTATGAWVDLPGDLRHPGGIGRVFGVVMTTSGDVVLIGRTARRPSAALDIDSITLLFSTVWRQGRTPSVSLDPRGEALTGPMYPRLVNVPPDTEVARIMLEADYALKTLVQDAVDDPARSRILFPELGVSAPYDTLKRLTSDRFWLQPNPLPAASIELSQSGRTAVFDTGVEVLTESTLITDNDPSSTANSGSQLALAKARALTMRYEDLEEGTLQAGPDGVYEQLHGLIDLTTAATLLRLGAFQSTSLTQLTDLPVRKVPTRSSYPNVHALVAVPALKHAYFQYGGVAMRPRLSPDAHKTRLDGSLQKLETAADALSASGQIASAVDIKLKLPTALVSPELAAVQNLARRDFLTAEQKSLTKVRLAPSSHAAWEELARARLGLGDLDGAMAAIDRALTLAPIDPDTRVLAMDIAWRRDPEAAYAALKDIDTALRDLSHHYFSLARAALDDGSRARAESYAGWAAELWSGNFDAHLLRAQLRVRDGNLNRTDLSKAKRALLRLQSSAPDAARKPLALVLTLDAQSRLARVERLIRSAVADPNDAAGQAHYQTAFQDLQQAFEATQKAGQLDPQSAEPGALQALVRAYHGALFLEDEGAAKKEIETALLAARAVAARHPDSPFPPLSEAAILLVQGDPEEAEDVLRQAVKVFPENAALRRAHAEQAITVGACAHAGIDIDFLSALNLPSLREDVADLSDRLRSCSTGRQTTKASPSADD
ncbi:tetratricopeptide repeat protein [Roseibium sediminicola]|uniref:Tetratricopeptide repeat protein n=1 Tax=Roseibium sediminicola TaxID=2933272 RepID=A0ABT0GMN6_9HYPH|nr:hypothetical protein [Roseibium sp. CAU 1639]MCK7610686.1 hypothetical protein [Roseibium sp. CAU 1639]